MVLDDMSLNTHLNVLHIAVRSGCGVAFVGYMVTCLVGIQHNHFDFDASNGVCTSDRQT